MTRVKSKIFGERHGRNGFGGLLWRPLFLLLMFRVITCCGSFLVSLLCVGIVEFSLLLSSGIEQQSNLELLFAVQVTTSR